MASKESKIVAPVAPDAQLPAVSGGQTTRASANVSSMREIVDGIVSLRAEWAAMQAAIVADGTEAAGALAEALDVHGARLEDNTNPWPLKHIVEPSVGGGDPFVRATTGIVAMIAAGERAAVRGLAPQIGLKRFAKVALETKDRASAIHALESLRAEDERARQAGHARAHEERAAKKPPPAPPSATGAPPSVRANPLLATPEEPEV